MLPILVQRLTKITKRNCFIGKANNFVLIFFYYIFYVVMLCAPILLR